MLDTVLEDVKGDFKLVEKSYNVNSAVGAIKAQVMKYVATGQMSYAEGVRMVGCLLFILSEYKKEKTSGN